MRNLFFCFCFCFFHAFAYSQTYNIYVSDAGNFNAPPWQILKFDQNGLNPVVFINQNLNWPQDILFLNNPDQVLISNLGTGLINRHDANSGVYISAFASGIAGPTRMKIGPDSLLYVLQWSGNGKVRRYNLNGTFLGEFTSIGVPQSIGIDWDKKGNLYVSSYSGDLVRKFDTSGNDLGVFVDSNLAGPTNIWFDKNGDLLVIDYDGTAVKRFDSSGKFLNEFMTELSKAEGFATFPNGNILIGNGASSSVKLFDSTGVFIKDFVASNSANLLNPNAIVIREASLNFINTKKKRNSHVVYPSIGREFNFDKENINNIKEIRIHNSQGTYIEKIIPRNITSWKANDYTAGIYVLNIQFNDGTLSHERVVVVD